MIVRTVWMVASLMMIRGGSQIVSAFSQPTSTNRQTTKPINLFAHKKRQPGPTTSTAYTSLQASVLEGLGMPSNPGWRSGRLNRLTEWADAKTANRPIVCEYEPSGFWLWKKWQGTVLKITLRSCLILMTVGMFLDWSVRKYIMSASSSTWSLLSVPPASEPLIQSLSGLKKLWEYQLTGKTFKYFFFLLLAETQKEREFSHSCLYCLFVCLFVCLLCP